MHNGVGIMLLPLMALLSMLRSKQAALLETELPLLRKQGLNWPDYFQNWGRMKKFHILIFPQKQKRRNSLAFQWKNYMTIKRNLWKQYFLNGIKYLQNENLHGVKYIQINY